MENLKFLLIETKTQRFSKFPLIVAVLCMFTYLDQIWKIGDLFAKIIFEDFIK